MAKIKAHGTIIGTIEYAAYSKRYMSDGKVLKNSGFGWKIYGTVKPETTPQDAYDAARMREKTMLRERPAYAAFRKQLHDLAGCGKRWKLVAALELMPDDPDGVWSECCDGYGDNVHADVDDVVHLCQAYKAAIAEAEEFKRARAAA